MILILNQLRKIRNILFQLIPHGDQLAFITQNSENSRDEMDKSWAHKSDQPFAEVLKIAKVFLGLQTEESLA